VRSIYEPQQDVDEVDEVHDELLARGCWRAARLLILLTLGEQVYTDYQFHLTATDSEAATTSNAVRVATRLAINAPRLQAATVARAYHAKLAVRGGVQPLRWRVVRGKLPPGVLLVQRLGTLAGVPRGAGSFRITVEAVDALGAKSQKTLVLLVVR